jgi:hypothetical protein
VVSPPQPCLPELELVCEWIEFRGSFLQDYHLLLCLRLLCLVVSSLQCLSAVFLFCFLHPSHVLALLLA